MAISITACGTLLASVFGAWATANTKLYEAKQDIAVVEERENLHYKEVQRQLSEVNRKLDILINIGK